MYTIDRRTNEQLKHMFQEQSGGGDSRGLWPLESSCFVGQVLFQQELDILKLLGTALHVFSTNNARIRRQNRLVAAGRVVSENIKQLVVAFKTLRFPLFPPLPCLPPLTFLFRLLCSRLPGSLLGYVGRYSPGVLYIYICGGQHMFSLVLCVCY